MTGKEIDDDLGTMFLPMTLGERYGGVFCLVGMGDGR